MTRVRRILGRMAAVWLLCQAAGLAAAPLALWITAPADLVECTCEHGDHAMCPMHHPPASDTRCVIQATQESGTAVLSTLLSGVGVVASASVTIVAPPMTTLLLLELTPAAFRPAPPDPPPPRA
jgi:hypothetical protein